MGRPRAAGLPGLLNWLVVVVLGPLVVWLNLRYNLSTAAITPTLPYFLGTLIYLPPLEAALAFLVAASGQTIVLLSAPHVDGPLVSERIVLLGLIALLIWHIKRRIVMRSQALRQAREQLTRVNQGHERLLDLLPVGVILVDLGGRIVQANKEAERLFGYRDPQMRTCMIEELVPTEQRVAHRTQRMDYLRAPEARQMGARLELAGQRQDGSRFPIQVGLAPVDLEQGRVITATVTDITERERTTQALAQANRELQRASQVKDQFLATMSHEIRTPMNGVIGMTGLLLDSALTDEQREYANVIRSSGEALMAIINDILDFSKIEAGQIEMEQDDVDVRACVEEALDFVSAQTRCKGLELATLVEVDVPPHLYGDASRLRQVYGNLLSNAVKFTAAGEVVLHVSVAGHKNGAVLLHSVVRDTGIGIALSDQERLFHPFSQADASTTRRYGGTGLGLAICKRLVELMGGQIGVESVPGQGSTFWFTVPLPVLSGAAERMAPPPVDLHAVRVLIVDDNATNRQVLHYQVTSWGMRNGAVSSAAEALALLRAAAAAGEPYQICITDLDMPGMDGLALARAVRDDDALAPLRIVLLGSISPPRNDPPWQSVINAHITKPVRQGQLYAALVQALRPPKDPSFPPVESAPVAGPVQGLILLAEDNPVNQYVAARMLEKLGFRTDTVSNGEEAVLATGQKAYSLVLMDCLMPVMDGYEAARAIRQQEAQRGLGQHVPIVAMTALALAGDAERSLAAGMDDHIPKPVTLSHLAAVLQHWVREDKNEPNKEDSNAHSP